MRASKLFLAMLILFSPLALAQTSHVVPEGREIKVRTDTAIPAKPPANAKYSATVSNDVSDSSINRCHDRLNPKIVTLGLHNRGNILAKA
jgi:hypothetical protein